MEERWRSKKGEMQMKEVVQTQLFVSSHRKPMPSQSLSNGYLSKTLLPLDFSGWRWLYMQVPPCSFGSDVLVRSSHLFYSPICLAGKVAWDAKQDLLWCECCSARAKPQFVVKIILVTQQSIAPEQIAMRKLSSNPARPSTRKKR